MLLLEMLRPHQCDWENCESAFAMARDLTLLMNSLHCAHQLAHTAAPEGPRCPVCDYPLRFACGHLKEFRPLGGLWSDSYDGETMMATAEWVPVAIPEGADVPSHCNTCAESAWREPATAAAEGLTAKG